MEEIKSVRVRSLSGDIKVTISESGRKRKVVGISNGISIWGQGEYGGSRYRDKTDDEIISDFIETNRKSEQKEEGYYQIVQNPYQDIPPRKRNYGSDPYYLNNGSSIYISWLEGITSAGGSAWSNDNGEELNIKTGLTQSTKGFITKTTRVVNSPTSEQFTLDKNNALSKYDIGNSQEYVGTVTDLDIIKSILFSWKSKVPNYDVALCDPDNESCSIIEYKSPLEELVPEATSPIPTEESTQGSETRVKLSVVLPGSIEIKVKEDLNEIKVYVGDPPLSEGDFVFQDDFDNLEELDPEFSESAFAGVEEGGEQLYTESEYDAEAADAEKFDLANEQSPNNTPGASTGIDSTGTYTSVLTKESNKGDKNIKYGFNGVPYYGQYDPRWANVIYGLSEPREGARHFIEANVKKVKKELVSVSWKGKTYKIKCAHSSGTGGFSSIQGGGCGITSFSMVVNYWMIKNNTNTYTSPVKMAKLACDTKARKENPDPSGTHPNSAFYKKIKEVFGLSVSSSSRSEVESLVKKGYPQVVCGRGWTGYKGDGSKKVQGGGHFIVITGYDHSNKIWRVNDPGSSKNGTYYFKGPSLPSQLTAFYKTLPSNLA